MKLFTLTVFVLAMTVIADGRVLAQQTTGSPGSPSATTTIDGKYLPPPGRCGHRPLDDAGPSGVVLSRATLAHERVEPSE